MAGLVGAPMVLLNEPAWVWNFNTNQDIPKALRELENEIESLISDRESLAVQRRGVRSMVKAGSLEGKVKLQTVRYNENLFQNLIKIIVYRGESRMGMALQMLG